MLTGKLPIVDDKACPMLSVNQKKIIKVSRITNALKQMDFVRKETVKQKVRQYRPITPIREDEKSNSEGWYGLSAREH